MVVVIGGGCGSQEMGLGLKIGKYENKNGRFVLSVFGFGDKDRVSFYRSHISFGGRIWDSGGRAKMAHYHQFWK